MLRKLPILIFAAGGLLAADDGSRDAGSWNKASAAAYLDARATWWIGWPSAARGNETFCISCHTALPYALSRAALRESMGDKAPTGIERQLLDNVAKRVSLWEEIQPYYSDAKNGAPKTLESRGTESVLNALILATYDARTGKLSATAKRALDSMWAEQPKTGDTAGAIPWLQFHNAPWEGDSQFFGNTLAALAAGSAPGNYRSTPEIQEHLKLLREYLAREQASQKLIDRMMLLWACSKLPGWLPAKQMDAIRDAAFAAQQPDGGFSLSTLVGDWRRKDKTPLETKSDGYATGVVAFTLLEAGVKRDEPRMQKALAWLEKNQEAEGRWLAYSLNKQRDLASDAGKFMSDAATAYAVLALTRPN